MECPSRCDRPRRTRSRAVRGSHLHRIPAAVSFAVDESCPYICIEHAIENERRAMDVRKPWLTVRYPYTNCERAPGITVYVQLEPAYVA